MARDPAARKKTARNAAAGPRQRSGAATAPAYERTVHATGRPKGRPVASLNDPGGSEDEREQQVEAGRVVRRVVAVVVEGHLELSLQVVLGVVGVGADRDLRGVFRTVEAQVTQLWYGV